MVENEKIDLATIAPNIPWNVWKNEIEKSAPQAFNIPHGKIF